MELLKSFALKNKYWLILVIVFLCLGYVLGQFAKKDHPEDTSLREEVVAQEVIEEEVCEVFVDISGAVNIPGVYCLSSESIIDDLISSADGFTDQVCKEWVDKKLNKAQIIQEGLKLYIPRTEDEECKFETIIESTNNSSVTKVSINNASQEELESLTGIGPTLAKSIISGRPYSSLEDVKTAKGIGESLFDKIKDFISL